MAGWSDINRRQILARYGATIEGAEALRKLAKDLESSSSGIIEAADKLNGQLDSIAEKGPEVFMQLQSIVDKNTKAIKDSQEPLLLLSQNLQNLSDRIMMLLGNVIMPDVASRTGDGTYEEFTDGIASGSFVLEEPELGEETAWAYADDIVGSRYHDDVSNEDFWSHHGNTKEMYCELVSKVPAVQIALESGRALDELRQDPELGACASQFFSSDNMIRVYKFGGKYVFDGDGRHRLAAAQELGIRIPVKIVRVVKRSSE